VITGVETLGEPLTANFFISGTLIIGGVLLACREQSSEHNRQDSFSE
jgi:drug/metabolite transporter (DMT)-like permease